MVIISWEIMVLFSRLRKLNYNFNKVKFIISQYFVCQISYLNSFGRTLNMKISGIKYLHMWVQIICKDTSTKLVRPHTVSPEEGLSIDSLI